MADMIFKGCENYQALSEYACHCLFDIIRKKLSATLRPAIGGTPQCAFTRFDAHAYRQRRDVIYVTFD